jgi:hypothetical protein
METATATMKEPWRRPRGRLGNMQRIAFIDKSQMQPGQTIAFPWTKAVYVKARAGNLVKLATLPDGRLLRDPNGAPVRETKDMKRARRKAEKKMRLAKRDAVESDEAHNGSYEDNK